MKERNNCNETNGGRWVGTWAASPYLVTPDNMPPSPGLSNNTLRQVIRVSVGGEQFRLKLSNEYGDAPLTINSIHLAVSDGQSDIKPKTDKVITFSSREAITIPAGQTVISDTITYTIESLSCMAITIHFGEVPDSLTGHPGSRTNSYLEVGNAVTAKEMPLAALVERWYVIAGIDVLTSDSSYCSIVALGDSITDGRGTTTDHNNRWTDILANRLQEGSDTNKIGVLNQGIGGNAVLTGGLGPAARLRFDRDVLGQCGVRYLILLEGVNDIGSDHFDEETVTELIAAYKEFIKKAHDNKILAYGATILPFDGSQYGSDFKEQMRRKINDWIRTSGEFDAVIDFAEAVKNNENPSWLHPDYDSGDHLHLSPEGYKKMGDCIDLNL